MPETFKEEKQIY